MPISHLPDLETSRAKLLGALAGANDITFIRSYGNLGDHLIWAGTRRLLADIPYREVSILQLDGVAGELALVTGGGDWCRAHHAMPQFLLHIETQFERVVVLPTSFDVAEEGVRQVLARTKALVFARERASYEQIRDLCQADLAHDTAYFFDFRPYERAGQGLLTAYRTDAEATGRPLPPGNNDISLTCESLDEWLWTIARHETIETDRAHVMIAAALLGKRVNYRASNYHKVPALAEFLLPDRPVTQLTDSHAALVREELVRQARAYEARLPAGFVAAHAQLEVTVVMLSHGRIEQTLKAVRALQEHVRIPFKLLIVDNDSGAEVRARLAEITAADGRIGMILLDENLGCAGGRAHALEYVTTPYALLLDNDVEVLPGTVEHLLYYIEQHPRAAAVMGKLVFPNGLIHLCGGDYKVEDGLLCYELLDSGRRFDAASGASGTCRWISGGVTLLRTAVFNRHPYDLRMRHYYEDLEWCYRLNQAGVGEFHRVVEALAIHNHEPKAPDASWSAEELQQAMNYVETIAHFYRQHGVIIPNLFDFVPELCGADGQRHLAAARALLTLVNTYGGARVLEQWERGQLAPLFAGGTVPPGVVAALEDEVATRREEPAQVSELNARRREVVALNRELASRQHEIVALKRAAAARQQAWDQWLAQSARREQELEVIFNSNAWRVVNLYWRVRRALRLATYRRRDE